MLEDITGHVLIVMAPMGSGKGTLIRRLREKFPTLELTVSCTTRAPRPGEVDGQDYHFLTPDQFTAKIAAGEFLEWATFGLHRYGTLKSEIIPRLQTGKIVIAEIEVQGVEQLHQLIPAEFITTAYIEAGGWEVLKARALARAPMDEVELAQRHERYLVEREMKQIADVIIDNSNDDIDRADAQFQALIQSLYARLGAKNK